MVRTGRKRHRRVAIPILFGILILTILIGIVFPFLLRDVLFAMPSPSDTFDCDDSSLLMADKLSTLGITSTPILGNLKKTGELYWESDHVWLMVNIRGWKIALDWGILSFDGQHYEGYSISREQLIEFVAQDWQQQSQGIANPP